MTTHQTAECSIPDCCCHSFSRQDAPLVQVPLEHVGLKSLKEALVGPFDDEWRRAPEGVRGEYNNDYYWYLVGKRHGRQEALELQVSDLREIQRLVGGRME